MLGLLACPTLAPLARAGAPPRPPDASRTQRVVNRWLASKALEGVRVGVAVVALDSGAELAQVDGDTLYNPASGTKLLTTAAALGTLPLTTAWSTRVYGTKADFPGRLVGALVLQGGGDPKLLLGQVDALVAQLVSAGVTQVPDGVVVDASHFDAVTLPPAYDQKTPDAGYRPSVGAAGFNFGALRVTVRPGSKAGAPVVVEVEAACDGVVVDSDATTAAGAADALVVRATEAEAGRTRIHLTGSLGLSAPAWSERRRLHDPDAFTGYLLRDRLRKAGVDVGSAITVRHDRAVAPAPPLLAEVIGAPLTQTMADINTWSNNYMAETLLKQLGVGADGAAATWERAVEVAKQALVAWGLAPASFRVVNGSGLYRATHVSPRAMVKLLRALAADPVRGPPFIASLAVAGQPGTLEHRLRGKLTAGKLRGKTGTLDEVVSLSGYLPTRGGDTIAFAIFINDATPERTAALRGAIDRLVVKLAKL